jgi:transcriptional regulator with XRE-family HTH domain
MATSNSITLTRRRQMRAVLKRHRGSQAALARELGVPQSSVALWLKGKFDSQRFASVICARVAELAAAELAATEGETQTAAA